MKTSIKTSLTALALTVMVAGPAAANVSSHTVENAVCSAVNNGNVDVKVENGVATLFGWVGDRTSDTAAKQAALSFDEVDSVVNLISVWDDWGTGKR